jgi:ADP-L-glycero-D-manno-heptose 6-epimerase
MNIFLTGHRGFIGSHMLRTLLDLGHQVHTYEWGDSWPDSFDFDWAIHLGAISSTVERNVDKIMTQNFDFTRHLYDVCKSHGVNLQYASSASVYGMGRDFRESAPPDPRTPYAWSKYLCERYHAQTPSTNTVQGFRYFNVYGPNGEEHKNHQASPFYQFREQAERYGRIELFQGSENHRRDFIQVDHLIDLQLRFLETKESGIWNIGTGTTRSFREVAEMFDCEIVEVPIPDVLKSNYQDYTCADMTKTRQTLDKI